MPGKEEGADRLPGLALPQIPDHTLLRRIARGSYGHIWLARNAMGVVRAVKVVYREQFENDRPYEREFEGLKLFEPISRAHEGLVDILHLGRNNEQGYFYYIMEAADDAASEQRGTGVMECGSAGSNSPQESINPSLHHPISSYVPRTLEYEIRTRKRLPARECVEIGLRLADALAYLHDAELVHRDVKPSNIIFVNGVPKLADIGLVAEAGGQHSFVGTEGFVPREGPGSPQADIYSLGKVIYEMAMGKDRQAFPSLPTQLAEFPDVKELVALNDVIDKACETEARQRYQNARELEADLERVKSGAAPQSASRNALGRADGKQTSVWKRVAISAAVVLFAVSSFSLYQFSRYKLKVLHKKQLSGLEGEMSHALPANWYGTSNTDLVFPIGDKVHVVAHSGEHQLPIPIENPKVRDIWLSLANDIDQDGADEIFLSWAYGEGITTNKVTPVEVFLATLNKDKHREKTFRCMGTATEHTSFGVSPSGLSALQICDLKGDGRKVLLATIFSAWSKHPRGLWCFDFATTQTNWFFETASGISAIDVRDVNGDGRKEIVIGTAAPGNGSTNEVDCRGTRLCLNDSQSSLFLLSDEGKLLWCTNTGAVFTSVIPLPIGNLLPTGTDILACYSEGRLAEDGFRTPAGRLLVFDAQFNPKPGYDVGSVIWTSAVQDIDDDGRPEVLLTDDAGYLHVLNWNSNAFNLRHRIQLASRRPLAATSTNRYTWVDLRIAGVTSLSTHQNNEKQIILACSEGEQFGDLSHVGNRYKDTPECFYYNESVIVLDRQLRVLARHPVNHVRNIKSGVPFRVFATESKDHGPEILVLSHEAQFLKLARW